KVLTVGAALADGAAIFGAAAAGFWATGAALARGADGADAAGADAGAGAADGAADAPVGPPGGSVGSFMVGAADGFGGRLMRTVSFLGWTLPVSFFGGTAPPGMLGMFSAINLPVQDRLPSRRVKLLFAKTKPVSARFVRANARHRCVPNQSSDLFLDQLAPRTAEKLLDEIGGIDP